MTDVPESSTPCAPCCFSRLLLPLLGVVVLFAVFRGLRGAKEDALVVYCAHDAMFSEQILHMFEERTDIPVVAKFDTEATKALGLVELLIREKGNSRCDVFWNNEILGMMDLEERGVLEPYKGEGHARIPDAFKDPEGHWTGFGGRLRVYIVNTGKMEATEAAVESAFAGDLSRCAIAKPLYGTTLTQYSVLWHQDGADGLKSWHGATRERGINEVLGNATVRDLVAAGTCDFGLTDTDDFFGAKDAGKPVAMLPVRVRDGATICIPNTVAVIKGTARPEAARQLVDFLLSAECELLLARGEARQIPLGPVDDSELPEDVRELRTWAADGYSLAGILDARNECLSWLKGEYVPGAREEGL